MAMRRSGCRAGRISGPIVIIVGVALCTIAGSCRRAAPSDTRGAGPITLSVGVAQLSANSPVSGLKQLSQILSLEGLARVGEDGLMQPWLAESWTQNADRRSLTVKLRQGVKMHDGAVLDAKVVEHLLPEALRSLLGPVFSDVEYVKAVSESSVEIAFREASPFLVESLEAQIQKAGSPVVGTGPFMVVPNSNSEMRSNTDYYLGRPVIDSIHVETYPSVRSAWAEMLRDRLDFLYEVGPDGVASMKNSSTIATYAFTRRYQHVVAFNPEAAALRSAEIRRALNFAVDRSAVVNGALNGYGTVSSGPVWPNYWALQRELPRFEFDPKRAAEMLATARQNHLHFTCLVAPDPLDERIALEAKRELAAIGVEMNVEEASRDEILRRAPNRQYDAVLTEVISGPTLVRPYIMWHSKSPVNWGHFGNPNIDIALDRVRHAGSNDYRGAVTQLNRAFFDDPPAIFLAWSVRARAVTKRFSVPAAEPGREMMSTLRLWKPTLDERRASRN